MTVRLITIRRQPAIMVHFGISHSSAGLGQTIYYHLLLQLREHREHDHPVLHQSVQFWKASGGEGGDRVPPLRGRPLHLQDPPQPHVRVHDQLHPEAQALARTLYDE